MNLEEAILEVTRKERTIEFSNRGRGGLHILIQDGAGRKHSTILTPGDLVKKDIVTYTIDSLNSKFK